MSARPGSAQQSRTLTIDADPIHLAHVRHVVTQQFHECGAGDDSVAEIVLAVSELVTNAIEHSDESSLVIELFCESDAWIVQVSGADGIVSVDDRTDAPNPKELTGRGLFLVHSLMDRVELVEADGHRHLRCTKQQ